MAVPVPVVGGKVRLSLYRQGNKEDGELQREREIVDCRSSRERGLLVGLLREG